MKALKLTPKQKEVFDLLEKTPGGVVFKHVKPSGTLCYRLLDAKRNPILNIRMGIIEDLIQKGVLVADGMEYKLSATNEHKEEVNSMKGW